MTVASTCRTASKRRVHPGGELGAPAQHVGLAEAGAQVVAAGDALLQGGGVVGPGRLLDDLARGDLRQQRAYDGQRREPGHREEEERRPPGHAGDDPERAGTRRRCGSPSSRSAAAGCRPRGCRRRPGRAPRRRPARSAPTSGWCMRGVEQVGAQLALGAVHDAGPQGAARRCRAARRRSRRPRARRPGGPSRARRAGRRRGSRATCRRRRPRRRPARQTATGVRRRRQSTVRAGAGGSRRADVTVRSGPRVVDIGVDGTTRHGQPSPALSGLF